MRGPPRSSARARAVRRLASLAAGCAIASGARNAEATVNIEAVRARLEEREGLSGQIELRFSMRQGNVNVLDFAGASHLAFRRKRHFGILISESRLVALTTWRRGQSTSDLSDPAARIQNMNMGHARYNFAFLDWLRGEAFTQLQADEFLIVRTRFLIGVGPRFVAYEGKVLRVAFGTSYMAELEDLDQQRLVRQRPPAPARNWWHRWNNYASVSAQLGERLGIAISTYVQPRFDMPRDLRVSATGELSIDLGEHWAFKLRTSLDYDSLPPVACARAIEPGSVCAREDEFPLRSVDLGIQNALTVKF
jgi:hypothetical protein